MDRNSTRMLVVVAAAGIATAFAGCKTRADVKSGRTVDGTVEMTMNYPIVLGNEDVAEHFGGLLGYPSSYLISRDGKVVKRIIGLVSEDELAHEIELQLSTPAFVSSTSTTSATSQSANSKFPDEPAVTFQELQGGTLPLASLKGKVVLVNFWATWCDPCQIEIPWLIGFQQKYANQGFTIIGVAMDEEGRSVVEPFVEKTKFEVSKDAAVR